MTKPKRDYGSGGLRKRGRSWEATLRLRPDPLTGRRPQKSFTGRTRTKALRLRAAYQRRLDEGMVMDAAPSSVAAWLLTWVESHYSDGAVNERSYERYSSIIRRHLIPGLGHLALGDLRYDHVADVRARWLSGEDSTAVLRAIDGKLTATAQPPDHRRRPDQATIRFGSGGGACGIRTRDLRLERAVSWATRRMRRRAARSH